jgi:hypothetical protein
MIDLRHRLIDIEAQGRTNSCTAHAATSALEVLLGDGVERSRSYLYYMMRDTHDNVDSVTMDKIISALQVHGCPPEVTWPWDAAHINREPPQYVKDEAGKCRVTMARYCPIAQIKDFLNQSIPVIAGLYVREGFKEITGVMDTHAAQFDGYLNRPRTGVHAVLVVGYNDVGYICANSYGPEYGDNGCALIPYAVLETDKHLNVVLQETNVPKVAVPAQPVAEERSDSNMVVIAVALVAAIMLIVNLV